MAVKYLAASILLALPALALAHPGGLNSEGCHNNRKTGDYHCHGQGSRSDPPRAAAPQRAYGAISSGAIHGYYRSCSAARMAGAAPIRRGQPGYGSHLDRDGDGIACE